MTKSTPSTNRQTSHRDGPSSAKSPAASSVSLPTQAQIATRAYELYEASGYVDGHCQENWLQAEAELLKQFRSRVSEPQHAPEVDRDDAEADAQDLGSSHLHLSYSDKVPAGVR